METRKFKDLTIRDAFMFAAVMSDPEICRRVLELALGIPISEVHIQTEKTMAYHSEYHGVRLDVYADDAEKRRFNVEMQVTLQKFLPKRSRYYHDQIDMDALLAGDSYENLPDTYVIFICDFDPFGDGLYRYSTGMVCEETGKSVSDGVRTVYLNAHGRNRDGIPEELLQFLNYVKNTGRAEEISTTDPFVRHLQDSIDKIIRRWCGHCPRPLRPRCAQPPLPEGEARTPARGTRPLALPPGELPPQVTERAERLCNRKISENST